MKNTNWLIIETLPNWRVDKKNKFSHFGITNRYVRLKDRIKAGDRLFTYVTGISSFSDIREVTEDGLRNLLLGGDYEGSLPYCIDTKPILVLPREKWISIHDIKDELKLTSGQKYWGAILRAAPRMLDQTDAVLLIRSMQKKLES